MILAIVGKKGATTGAVNAAWKKERRAGKANPTLTELVKAKKLKRLKVKGMRGSKYILA